MFSPIESMDLHVHVQVTTCSLTKHYNQSYLGRASFSCSPLTPFFRFDHFYVVVDHARCG